jgi:hypothetical protein
MEFYGRQWILKDVFWFCTGKRARVTGLHQGAPCGLRSATLAERPLGFGKPSVD